MERRILSIALRSRRVSLPGGSLLEGEEGRHNRRVQLFTNILLCQLARLRPDYGLTPQRIATVTRAAALHDIGKIAIPPSVLRKPGPLTPEEFAVMKTHPLRGGEILEAVRETADKPFWEDCRAICRCHHERWDGRGYPAGLYRDEIPISAQVVSLADVYDALRSQRVYKPAVPHEQALSMVLNGECGAFSPSILECLCRSQELLRTSSSDQNKGSGRFGISS